MNPYPINGIIRIAVVTPSTYNEVDGVLNDDPGNFSSRLVQDETKVILMCGLTTAMIAEKDQKQTFERRLCEGS